MCAHLFDSLRREAISADGNAFKVLRWAVKHKHTDIIDKAAQSAISLPITRVRMVLEPNLYLAWVRCLPPPSPLDSFHSHPFFHMGLAGRLSETVDGDLAARNDALSTHPGTLEF